MLRVSTVLVAILLIGSAVGSTVGAPARPALPQASPQDNATANETNTASEGGQSTDSFPPGASASGIDNASKLVQTHIARLKETSYADRHVSQGFSQATGANATGSNFDVSNYGITVEHDANGSAVHIRGPNSSNQYWITDDSTARNITNTEYGYVSSIYEYSQGDGYRASSKQLPILRSPTLVEPYLRDLEFKHVGTTTRNSRTLHTYSSTGINQTVKPNHGDTPVRTTTESINATVVVSERGIIRSFTAQETHTVQNESVTVEHRYIVEQIGTANVSTPAWVTEEITRLDASYAENGSAVALTHTGGRSVTNTSLWLHTPNSTTQTAIDGTVGPGDTLYVALRRANGSNRTLVTSINEPPPTDHSFVSLAGGNLSVATFRTVTNDHDSGVKIDVTIDRESANTSGSEDAGR